MKVTIGKYPDTFLAGNSVLTETKETELLGYIVTSKGVASKVQVRFPNLGGVYEFSMGHGWASNASVSTWRILPAELERLQQDVKSQGFRVNPKKRTTPTRRGVSQPAPKERDEKQGRLPL